MHISKIQSVIYRTNTSLKPVGFKNAINCSTASNGCLNKTPINFTSIYDFEKKPKTLLEGQMYQKDDDDYRIFTRSFTRFFRPDLNWVSFADFIGKRFKDTDKVNTYVWGCSSGQEAYSMAMILQKTDGKNNKFQPILALDIDKNIIEKNISRLNRKIILPSSDVVNIHSNIHYTVDDYEDYIICHDDGSIGISKNILDSVEFSFGNIVTDFKGITDKKVPSIVMCRNMWPYIDSSKYDKVAKTMYETLAPGSIVVVGNYDLTGEPEYKGSKDFPKKLVENGFKPVKSCSLDNMSLIYEKPFEETN